MKLVTHKANIAETAKSIVTLLENCGFNDCTDSSGYFLLEKYEDDTDISIDVYKSDGEGSENPHYVIYCSYEDDSTDFKYTKDLSVESLIEALKEVCEVK